MEMGGNVLTSSKIVVTLNAILILAAGVWLSGRVTAISRCGQVMRWMKCK